MLAGIGSQARGMSPATPLPATKEIDTPIDGSYGVPNPGSQRFSFSEIVNSRWIFGAEVGREIHSRYRPESSIAEHG